MVLILGQRRRERGWAGLWRGGRCGPAPGPMQGAGSVQTIAPLAVSQGLRETSGPFWRSRRRQRGRLYPGRGGGRPASRRAAPRAPGPGRGPPCLRAALQGERTQSVRAVLPDVVGSVAGGGAHPGGVRARVAEAGLVPGRERVVVLALPPGRERGPVGTALPPAADIAGDAHRRPDPLPRAPPRQPPPPRHQTRP